MASSLLDMLARQTPLLQTRKALVLTGLQNDFLSPEGKLPTRTDSGFLDRLKELVPAFREYGDVIWVRSHYEANRPVNLVDESGDSVIIGSMTTNRSEQAEEVERNSPVPIKRARVSEDGVDRTESPEKVGESRYPTHRASTPDQDEDEELFLTRTATREPCCIPGSFGADAAPHIQDLIDDKKDLQVIKTYYSAFGSTSLLLTLRSRLITELFICGCWTNISVFATAMDAARYGIKITLVEDCLGYRRKDRHDLATRQLREIMGAEVMTSVGVIDVLKNPPLPSGDEEDDEADFEDEDEDGIAVGEDASGIHAGLSAADGDHDGKNTKARAIPPSTVSGRILSLRSAPTPEVPSLETSTAIEPLQVPTAECMVTPSARARATEPKVVTSDDDELFVHANNGDVAEYNESLAGYQRNQPWFESIESHYLKYSKPSAVSTTHPGLAALSAVVGLDQNTVNEYANLADRRSSQNDDQITTTSTPLFGDDKELESSGSRIHLDLLPPDLAETVFSELNSEVTWQRMKHQTGEVPRLVCCQGSIDIDGSMPVYRHPSDQTMPIQSWTRTVDRVRQAAEKVVGHRLNHGLIQLYRAGTDYISEHSDKTLDIVEGSSIVNVSFGAQRTMRLRTKRAAADSLHGTSPARTICRVPMPHNSMITMSLATNAEYLHGINADKRPAVEWSEDEKAFDTQRISITFRNIGTFLNADSSRIWGQGATSKTKDGARPVVNADASESEKLIRAFGAENQASKIDWVATYGGGFDVLHLK